MENRVLTAIVPAAGLGTRLLPATKSVPKELLPVYDRPLIQFAVDEARAAGIRRLVLVTHRSKTAIEDYFRSDPELRASLVKKGKHDLARKLDECDPTDAMELVICHQDEAKGLGHAILCAREAVAGQGPVAVILPDDIILGSNPAIAEMSHAYDHGFAAHMVGAQRVPRSDTAKYGICDCDSPAPGRQTEVSGLVEKPDPADAPSEVAIVGRYILGPEIFDRLENTEPGSGGEIQLTDAIAAGIGHEGVSAFHLTGQRHDCGHADGLMRASQAFRDSRMVLRTAAE